MTLTTTVTDAAYTPNGSTTVFPYPFKIFAKTDLEVYLVNATTLAEELQAVDTDYTVSGVGDATGGNVTMITAPVLADHSKLYIRRQLPKTQALDLQEGEDFPSENSEKRHDRHVMKIQELEEAIARCLRFNITSNEKDIKIPDLVADQMFQINSAADGINLVEPTTITPATTTISAYGKTLVDDADAAEARATLLIPGKNKLINGGFTVWQRGTTITAATAFPNNDDTYCADRWNLLSDGNDIVDPQTAGTVPEGSFRSMELLVATANKKAGVLQIIEGFNSAAFKGQKASLSFQAVTAAGNIINNIRAAIVEWTGARDVVTSDLVSAWGAQGVNPTVVANWAIKNTPADLALSTSFQRFTIENISISSSANNVGVFIWIDDTDAATGDQVFLADIQLEIGTVATEFERVPESINEIRCLRYFQKTFNRDVNPAQNVGSTAGAILQDNPTAIARVSIYRFPVLMRALGTVVLYNPFAANNDFRNLTDGTDTNGTSIGSYKSVAQISIEKDADATDDGDLLAVHATIDAEL